VKRAELGNGDLSGKGRDNLSDADFAAVWTDSQGNKQRKLPINDAAHVRNALARFDQTDMPGNVLAHARARLDAAARRFGIGDSQKKEKSMAEEAPKTPETPNTAGDEIAKLEAALDELKKGMNGTSGDMTPEAKALRRIATQLVEQRKLAEFAKKAEGFKGLHGTTVPALTKLIKEIAENSPEGWKQLEPLLKNWCEAFETSELFSEKGSSGADQASATDRAEALASERIAKGLAKNQSEALSQVFKSDPALYRAYRKETQVKV